MPPALNAPATSEVKVTAAPSSVAEIASVAGVCSNEPESATQTEADAKLTEETRASDDRIVFSCYIVVFYILHLL